MNPNFILLYVESPISSAAFYETLLGRPPIEASANFVMFVLKDGLMLGLWARHDVAPAATNGAAQGSEVAFTVEGDAKVDELHAQWRQKGVTIAQAPAADLGLGFAFCCSWSSPERPWRVGKRCAPRGRFAAIRAAASVRHLRRAAASRCAPLVAPGPQVRAKRHTVNAFERGRARCAPGPEPPFSPLENAQPRDGGLDNPASR